MQITHFEIINVGEYLDLYCLVIHYCWLKYLRTLEICVLKYTNSILQTLFFSFWISTGSSFKNTKIRLDASTDVDMLLMIEKAIRGGGYNSIF